MLADLERPIDTSQRNVIDLVYQKFGRAALSKLIYVVGRTDVATELLQEVFVRLWTKGMVFDAPEQLYAWIYRACHNAGIDYLRSAVHRRENSATMVPDLDQMDDCDIEGTYVAKEHIRSILTRFSQRDASIIAFVAIDEMTHDEAAIAVGVSKKTVTRAMVRARESFAGERSIQ